MKKKILILLIILSTPSIVALFGSGFFQSDDGEWMIIRFSAFYEALRSGQFPVRFLGSLNFGYGYPVANFLYPGFMYIGSIIHALGFGFVDTIKIIFGVSFLGSAFFAYLWLKKLFDEKAALVGALFYLYTPYHLFDIYTRGSIGEVLALAIIPFMLWATEARSIFFLSLGVFFLILSHNTIALFFLPLVFLYILIRGKIKKNSFKIASISFLLGGLMSSFFAIPALVELSYTNFYTTDISNINNYFATIDLIGASSLLVIGFAPIVYFFYSKNHKKGLFLLFLFFALFSLFLSSSASTIFWNFFPASVVQFPWRLLSYLVVSTAFLSAFIIFFSKRKVIIGLVLLLALVYSSKPFIYPKEFFNKGDSFYATNEATTTVKDEYMPKWVGEKPTEHFKEKVELVSGEGSIENVLYSSKRINFSADIMSNKAVARINTIYYPGWRARIDNNKSEISYSNSKGVMDIALEKGNNKIILVFEETALRLLADFISLAAFLILLFITKKKLLNFENA